MHITESCDYVLCISGYVQSLVMLPGVFQICRQKNEKKMKKNSGIVLALYISLYIVVVVPKILQSFIYC